MSRKRLKGIAAGLAQKFISRYNDVCGYWGLGVIYKYLVEKNEYCILFNLLSGEATPTISFAQEICDPYREWVFEQVVRNGISLENVKDIYIEIKFNVTIPEKERCRRNTRGEPYICKAVIVDDMSKRREFAIQGWVAAYGSFSHDCSI